MIKFKKAEKQDLNSIYLMGYDVWGENVEKNKFLADCMASIKYSKGTWYAGYLEKTLVTSLIVYQFENQVSGIGSVATDPIYRGKGYAKSLIRYVIETNLSQTFFLYSDIDSNFYKSLGFIEIENEKQPNKKSILMYYPEKAVIDYSNLPKYF